MKSASNKNEDGDAAGSNNGSGNAAEKDNNEEVKSAAAVSKASKEEKKEVNGEDSLSDLCMSEDEEQDFNLQEDFRQCGL